ncbi:hypothetical protein QBC46DRAFT_412178 [Diplogelasinospora grovesii]|uniref:Uncharacterized protein n=1 Tax=Diplogelasinospora grovesii TaxID=303347 RepID=A0AAN6N0J3_9PEZI|nr:hypothetical protein QBC46DRAFT_412178 [Diplogelasinospora grovesii]
MRFFTTTAILALAAVVVVGSPTPDAAGSESARDVTVSNANKKDRYCGIFSTGDKRNIMTLLYNMRKQGGNCVTPAKTCTRHACMNTSGVYVCNDNDHDITLDCKKDVADFGGEAAKCCTADWTKSKGISGQQFSDEGWNVIVAYANCNHDANSDRPAMGPSDDPWGPNGECQN